MIAPRAILGFAAAWASLAVWSANIVLVTERRTYLIEAQSSAGRIYAAQIAWRYSPPAAQQSALEAPAGAAAQQSFNFAYRWRTTQGTRPVWFPERVYDDGRRTWIDFPAQVAAGDLPPLFLMTGEGLELVNYRVSGARYEIDRVFDSAELRIGRRAPVVVRIDRSANRPSRAVHRGRR